MQHVEYEKGLLVATCWRLAQSSDVNELLAIACTIRNWVVARPGQVGPYRSYSEAAAAFLSSYELRPLPDARDPALVDPGEGLLARIDGVYDNSQFDVTGSAAFPTGARYFCRPQGVKSGSWQAREILARPDLHQLIGTFGSQAFYT